MNTNRAPSLYMASLSIVLFVFSSSIAQIAATGNDTKGSQTGRKLTGTLLDLDGPIRDADIILQSFKDEKCAKMFMSNDYVNRDEKYFEKRKKQLEACSKDLPAIKPDRAGQFEFPDMKAGWYALRFLWNIKQKPNTPQAAFWRNGYIIGYSMEKDRQGKYDTMAQGMAFYFSGKEDQVVSFDYNKK